MHIIDFAFPLVAQVDFRQALQAQGFPQIAGQQARRLRLHAQHRQRPASQFLGRMVRSRQAVRIHGQPRPSGRCGLLDRAVLCRFLRHAARGGPRLRHHVERGDGGRAEEISRPSVGERCGAAAGHARRHRSAGRRGQPPRPDGRQPSRQRRWRCAHRRRTPGAVLRACREARPADVPAPDRRDLPGHARRLRRRAAPEPRPRHRGQRRGHAADPLRHDGAPSEAQDRDVAHRRLAALPGRPHGQELQGREAAASPCRTT